MIVGSGERRHIHVVSCEKLIRLIDVVVPSFPMICDMVLDFIHVNFRHPAINIHDGQEQVVCWKIHLFEFEGHLFGTPIHVRPFSFVLIFPQFVARVVNLSEFRLKLIDNFLSLKIRTFFMFFHGQINEVILFCSFMSRHNPKSFSNDLSIFFVVRYYNCMQDFLVYLVSYLGQWLSYSAEYSPVLIEEVKTYQCKKSKLETCNYDQRQAQ